MPLYKVKIHQGAFINDSLYREGEVVELPEGINPNWGVLSDENGNELEDFSAKIRNQERMNEHLAKAIEGKDTSAVTQALAKENAEMKVALANMQKQLEKLTTAQAGGCAENPAPGTDTDPESGNPEKPVIDEAKAEQLRETVDMLEDGNDSHWTARGEPKLDVVKELTGIEVSRSELDAINDRRREKPKPEGEGNKE